MKLHNDTYDAALSVFERAVVAFCRGEIEAGEGLLATLDRNAIERDRTSLRQLARTAQPMATVPASERDKRAVSRATKEAVQARDRFHCRFTGRRLIQTQVFHEVSRISEVFHFDEHHSVKDTRRGRAGHPLVRSHGAAYEHVIPSACGGHPTVENIVHTSVQLNEAKGAAVLPKVAVPNDSWNGLSEHLSDLKRQRTSPRSRAEAPAPRLSPSKHIGEVHQPTAPRRVGELASLLNAASGLPVSVFASAVDPEAEHQFSRLRSEAPNTFFANRTGSGAWMIHRLHCSSLAFNGSVQLTLRPKVCASRAKDLHEWAKRLGVAMQECSRCRNAK